MSACGGTSFPGYLGWGITILQGVKLSLITLYDCCTQQAYTFELTANMHVPRPYYLDFSPIVAFLADFLFWIDPGAW
jgi:hypothetical protein